MHRQRCSQGAQTVKRRAQWLRLAGNDSCKVFELACVGVGCMHAGFFVREFVMPATLAAVLPQAQIGQ